MLNLNKRTKTKPKPEPILIFSNCLYVVYHWRDGRPAEYRWRPLFNATKFGWHPLLECHAVMLPRRETCWN